MKINSFTKNDITFTEISNDLGLRVEFCSLGASIFKIYLDKYLLTRNVKDIEDFKRKDIYHGKTIGRVSGRIPGNKLCVKDKAFSLENNEGENTLHGGLSGLSNKNFIPDIHSFNDHIELSYYCFSPYLESGFPGNLKVTVKYIVFLKKNELDVEYEATSDTPTVVSLTNHSYFTLANSNIRSLFLYVNSNEYLKMDDNLIPQAKETCPEYLNFSEVKRIITDIDNENLHTSRLNGYDHFFYFKDRDINKVNVSLSNSKIQMDIKTDFEGVVVYTSGWNDKVNLYPECENIYNSVAIEPSDSFGYLRILDKDQIYSRTIKYIFKYKD